MSSIGQYTCSLSLINGIQQSASTTETPSARRVHPEAVLAKVKSDMGENDLESSIKLLP